MSREYPWYQLVEGDELEQGDLFAALPVITPHRELLFPLPEADLPVEVDQYDVVVMTQSCDLTNDKVEDVILCPHWKLEDAGIPRNRIKEIRSGRVNRYLLLNSCEMGPGLTLRVVDFGRIFSVPKTYLRAFARSQTSRLRLLPPYREHLSQAFARFFMRVGLPQDIEIG